MVVELDYLVVAASSRQPIGIVVGYPPVEGLLCGFSKRSVDGQLERSEVSQTGTPEGLKGACRTFPRTSWLRDFYTGSNFQDPFPG